jgi:hypothetical protein
MITGLSRWILLEIFNGRIQLVAIMMIFTSIEQTTDGGLFLGGYSSSNISGDKTENSNLG